MLFKICLFITCGKIYGNSKKNNKPKTIVTTWNDEFELPCGSYSVSDIQDYIEYIIKDHETLPINPPIHIYINRLLFKVKDGY